jgi:hypothetical protein
LVLRCGEEWNQRIEKDGLKYKGLAEIAYWELTPWLLLAGVATNVISNLFSKDFGPCIPSERIQAEHVDGVR